jgi:hypothetical protein
MNDKKRFRFQESFECWGTEVLGASGLVAAPLEKRQQLSRLGFSLLADARVTVRLLRMWSGALVHPFMHRRALMCVFHRYYTFMNAHPDGPVFRMAADITDEVLASILVLPHAYTNIRSSISNTIVATDSTVSTAGACEARVPSRLARTLLRTAEQRGEYVRLDWNSTELEMPTTAMSPPDKRVDRLALSLPWGNPRTWEHRCLQHINLQEIRALFDHLTLLGGRGLRNSRVVCMNDSRVTVGAVNKGRSSSMVLNGLLRKQLGTTLGYGLYPALVWVSTHANPADYPSRHRELPSPESLPDWASAMWQHSGVEA